MSKASFAFAILQTLRIPLRIITSCEKKVAGNAVRESQYPYCLVTNSKHSNLYVMSYIIPAALSQTLSRTLKTFRLAMSFWLNISIWSLQPCQKLYLNESACFWLGLGFLPKMILKVWKISSSGKKCFVTLRYVSSSPRVRLGTGKFLRHVVSS